MTDIYVHIYVHVKSTIQLASMGLTHARPNDFSPCGKDQKCF